MLTLASPCDEVIDRTRAARVCLPHPLSDSDPIFTCTSHMKIMIRIMSWWIKWLGTGFKRQRDVSDDAGAVPSQPTSYSTYSNESGHRTLVSPAPSIHIKLPGNRSSACEHSGCHEAHCRPFMCVWLKRACRDERPLSAILIRVHFARARSTPDSSIETRSLTWYACLPRRSCSMSH